MGSLGEPLIRRIAIIGAGPAGVTAARYLSAEDLFHTIDIFEQQDSFGGVWNYSSIDELDTTPVPQTNPHQPVEEPRWRKADPYSTGHDGLRPCFSSPMYDNLESNLPHSVMEHTDDPSLEDHQLFPQREAVLSYLEQYAASIAHLVHFHTQVVDCQSKANGWLLTVKDLVTGRHSQQKYDAVVVATGHYSVPKVPEIKGLKAWDHAYPGIISHSKLYRSPTPYTDKKTIIIGNAASGTDIARHVATTARLPVLLSQRSEPPKQDEIDDQEVVPQIVEFMPPSQECRAVRFADGRVETDVDAIVFCTGYFFNYPFLSTLKPRVIESGERVKDVYQHLFSIHHPSLVFMGLPCKIIPFRTCEGQASVIAAVWSGRLSLPSRSEMQSWDALRSEHLEPRAFHILPAPKDLEYHNEMVDWASRAMNANQKRLPPKWEAKDFWLRDKIPMIRKQFAAQGKDRNNIRRLEDLGYDYQSWLKAQQADRPSC